MKEYGVLKLGLLLVVLGCSQWNNEDPVGISGGGESGYGKATMTTEQSIVGVWRDTNIGNADSYHQYIFNADMTYNYKYYYNGFINNDINGTYQVRGDILYLYLGDYEIEYKIILSLNQLTLIRDEYQIIFYRY
jgi:hypothetical protein